MTIKLEGVVHCNASHLNIIKSKCKNYVTVKDTKGRQEWKTIAVDGRNDQHLCPIHAGKFRR